MELVGIEGARLTALFLASRPEGQPHLPLAAAKLVERYKFAIHPLKVEDLTAERVHFGTGLFNDSPIDVFDIYNDGVVVMSRVNSNVLDEFLDDVGKWMEQDIGFKKIETHEINKNYESSLTFTSEAPIFSVIDRLEPIGRRVSQLVKSATALDVPFEPVGLRFAADPSKIAGMKPAIFSVERKAGIPFDKGFYFSASPLRTDDHLRVLEEIERLF